MTPADITIVIASLAILIYLYFVVWLWNGIKKAHKNSAVEKTKTILPLSILIAAHNEENSINFTLDSLEDQHYPKEKFEIVVVADRCSDTTVDMVKKHLDRLPMLQIIEVEKVPQGYSPKKFAIQTAIEATQYDNLILLDADCQLTPGALGCFNNYFHGGMEAIVSIPKFLSFPSILYNYYLPERILTWGIAAAAIGNRKPFLAFGPVWGYTKKAYEKAGGMARISHVLSGDDDLLVYQMGKSSLPIAFCFNPKGWGKTRVPHTFGEFVSQRRRHHSAGKFYATKVQIGYLLFHLSNLVFWIIPLFEPILILLLAAKFFVDFTIIFRIGRLFNEKLNVIHGLFFEIGFILHHIFIAPLAFVGKIRWR